MTKSLLVIQPGQKLPGLAEVPGDFSDWVREGMRLKPGAARVVRPQDGEALPAPADVLGVVVTGSGAMVTEQVDWMRATEAWLRDVVLQEVPVLGICFGHQLLAQALGGQVADNPRGIEVGTVETRLSTAGGLDRLFSTLITPCLVQASHQQSVITLPPAAVCLAASSQDPHHAFRYGEIAWGVQFHPEFDARIVAAYEDFYGPRLTPEYRARQAAFRQDHSCGGSILRAFWEICHSR